MLGRESGILVAEAGSGTPFQGVSARTDSQSRGGESSNAARAQRVLTIARAQAQVASRDAAAALSRARTVAAICAFIGVLGVCCCAATLMPDALPNGMPVLLGIAGVALGAVPAGLLGRLALRETPEAVQAAAAARATATAVFTDRLATAIDAAEKRGGLSDIHLRIFGDLIETAEADVERLSRDVRARRVASVNGRRHERIEPRHRRVTVRTADGRQLIGRIANVSLSGVALSEQLPRVAVGDEVTVGRQRAVATRLWANGIAFQFETELDPSTFDETIVL